jgi:hypothetical protein
LVKFSEGVGRSRCHVPIVGPPRRPVNLDRAALGLLAVRRRRRSRRPIGHGAAGPTEETGLSQVTLVRLSQIGFVAARCVLLNSYLQFPMAGSLWR